MSDLEILGTIPSRRALENIQSEYDQACESIIDAVSRRGSIDYAKYNWQNVPRFLRVTLHGAAEKIEDDPTILSQSGAAFITGSIVGIMFGRKLMNSITERRRYYRTVNDLFATQMTHDNVEQAMVANGQSAAQDIVGRGYWKLLALVGSEPQSSFSRRTSRVYSRSIAYMASVAHTERLGREVEKAQFGRYTRTLGLDSATIAMRHDADVLANGVLSDESLHHYLIGPSDS